MAKPIQLCVLFLWNVLFVNLSDSVYAAEIRVFLSADGKAINASFEGITGKMIMLKRDDGKVFLITKDKLSEADQAYILQAQQQSDNAVKQLNNAAGHIISNGSFFSARKAEELAEALQVPAESKSKYGRSWRLYAAFAKNYQLFGAMPYSVALYSNEAGFATMVSIVYANKGDFGSTAGLAEEHFKGGNTATPKTLLESMNRDAETVAKSLTSALGDGKSQRYGEGKTRREVTRWDWNGHAFLLSNEVSEYVSLVIVASTLADDGGKAALTRDTDVKKRLLASVIRFDSGDVLLSEIPMVDQGPKGYCVPATFERAMRTMGLEADMYLLAMVGESQAGGGTSPTILLENVKHQVLSKGRRIKEESVKQLRIRDFKRYIDEGIPLMWTLHSVEKYNEIANKNTKAREKVTDWKSHTAAILAENAEIATTAKPETNGHICMIVGYNEATQEVAVSDSWGPEFERRWVPIAVADWASAGSIFMILP